MGTAQPWRRYLCPPSAFQFLMHLKTDVPPDQNTDAQGGNFNSVELIFSMRTASTAGASSKFGTVTHFRHTTRAFPFIKLSYVTGMMQPRSHNPSECLCCDMKPFLRLCSSLHEDEGGEIQKGSNRELTGARLVTGWNFRDLEPEGIVFHLPPGS